MAKRGAAKGRHLYTPDAARSAGKENPDVPATKSRVRYKASTGKLVIEIFDGKLDRPQIVDCSAWLTSPNLAVAFAQALVRILPLKKRYRTRDQFAKNLTQGFFKHCESLKNRRSLLLKDLTTPFLRRFVDDFLGAKQPDGSFQYSYFTRIHLVGSLRQVVETLKRIDRASLPDDCDVPKNNWPGQVDAKSTEPLPMKQAAKFYKYCRRRAAETMKRMEDFWRSKDDIEKALAAGEKIRNTPTTRFVCAVLEISKRCEGFLPERQVLAEKDRVTFHLVERYGYKRAAAALYPQPKELVPFIYLLAFFTLFNAQPLLDLSRLGIRFREILGVMRVTFGSMKYRGRGKLQRRSFVADDADDNPARIVQFVLRWTEPLRKFCRKKIRNNLFIYSGRNKGAEPQVETYALADNGKSNNFNNHTVLFCGEGGFDWVGLRTIRATGAEIADLAFDGDPVAIQTLLGHSGAGVRERHYRSQPARRRGEVRLTVGMHLRNRWIDSNGKIDSRGPHKDESLSAATPGWDCTDPLNSPIPTETPGKLCAALGRCPGCPLAILNISSPYALGRCLQLKQRLTEERAKLGPIIWQRRWGTEYKKLTTFWLPQFTGKNVLTRGRQLTIPPFPPLD